MEPKTSKRNWSSNTYTRQNKLEKIKKAVTRNKEGPSSNSISGYTSKEIENTNSKHIHSNMFDIYNS